MTPRRLFPLLFLGLLATRLTHTQILWTEEGLPLAAAIQMMHGGVLYRDIWFDKPPLVPSIYLLWGAQTGIVLRVAGALFVLLACWLIYRFAREMWSEREGMLAAGLLALFLTFGIPAAVMPLAADLLMVVPHIAAVYLAWKGYPFWGGTLAGACLLLNSKAVFVLAACAFWQRGIRPLALLAAGFIAPNAAAVAWMAVHGSLGPYYQQVWELGATYARDTFVAHPVREGFIRTLNWAGFQASLVLGAAWFWLRDRKAPRWRLAAWALASLIAVCAGWRFFPRYYFQLLPVMTLAAARGFQLMTRKRAAMLLAIALAVPLARFGPRYATLAFDLAAGREHAWDDIAMDRDSRQAARLISAQARSGDTLFVWGYRPDVFAYTRMAAGSRFLESQPLTGVFADRHLSQTTITDTEAARAHRRELVQSHPTFLVDGLSQYNPKLSMESYEDLRPWLAGYEPAGRTRFSIFYKLRAASSDAARVEAGQP